MWFMLPALAILILFLAYPLGLGVWLSFTDARIGRTGAFIGIENYEWLWGDSVFWLSVFNTLLYTVVASIIKFAVGLYLAVLLNHSLPFKAIIRSIVLIPFIVPTVLSAIAFWWLYDSQFSIISWSLRQAGVITTQHRFSRRSVERALVGDLRQYLARRAVRRDHAAGGIADHAAVALRGRHHRRRQPVADVPLHHLSAAHPDHRRGDDLLGAVHLHRLPAHLGDDARRPGQRHPSDGDAELSARDPRRGYLGEGAAISTAMIPFLLAAILLSWFGLQRRKWQQGESND